MSSGFDEEDFGIFSYFGVSDPSKLKVIGNFIRDMQPASTIIIHRDRDFMTDAHVAEWEASVRAMKGVPFVTSGRDIEDSVINADYLAEANANLTALDASRLISESAEELRVDAIKAFVNGRIEAERKFGNTNPDMGEIAACAEAEVADNIRAAVKGKSLLAKLRNRYRAETGLNLRTRIPSAALQDAKLVEARKLQK